MEWPPRHFLGVKKQDAVYSMSSSLMFFKKEQTISGNMHTKLLGDYLCGRWLEV